MLGQHSVWLAVQCGTRREGIEQPLRGLAALLSVAGAVAGSAVALAAPPKALFQPGYNLCRAASLPAIRKAGGQRYRTGVFANRSCTWSRADLQAGITLSTHPLRVSNELMRTFLAQDGDEGLRARRIAVPGAAKAVVVTLPPSSPGQISKNLFANFGQGGIQVNMTAPRPLPDRRLIAVMRLVART